MKSLFFWNSKLVIFAVACSASQAYAQANLLVNGGFENGPSHPTRADGNLFVNMNVDGALGWYRAGPVQAYWNSVNAGVPKMNIVQVDGPGGFNYGLAGNQSDASGLHTMNRRRHYLEMFGDEVVYQKFIAPCTGTMNFGAWFSTRTNSQQASAVEIVGGVNPLLSSSIASAIVAPWTGTLNSVSDPWKLAEGQFNAVANASYIFRIRLPDRMNVDEVFLKKGSNCL